MYTDDYEYEIHACPKWELAQDYSPELSRHSATNRLAKWLRHNPKLWEELLDTGYQPKQKIFTSKQVAIIIHYLGEP